MEIQQKIRKAETSVWCLIICNLLTVCQLQSRVTDVSTIKTFSSDFFSLLAVVFRSLVDCGCFYGGQPDSAVHLLPVGCFEEQPSSWRSPTDTPAWDEPDPRTPGELSDLYFSPNRKKNFAVDTFNAICTPLSAANNIFCTKGRRASVGTCLKDSL